MNSQPLRVALVRSDEARARLLDHMAEGNRAKTGAAPLVADPDRRHRLPRAPAPHVPALPGRQGRLRRRRGARARRPVQRDPAGRLLHPRRARRRARRRPDDRLRRRRAGAGVLRRHRPAACSPWSTSAAPARTRGSRAARGSTSRTSSAPSEPAPRPRTIRARRALNAHKATSREWCDGFAAGTNPGGRRRRRTGDMWFGSRRGPG